MKSYFEERRFGEPTPEQSEFRTCQKGSSHLGSSQVYSNERVVIPALTMGQRGSLKKSARCPSWR